MTTTKLQEMFEQFSDGGSNEFLKFDRIANPVHRRPDICAFIMLDAAVPSKKNGLNEYSDMVSAAAHGEIFLDIGVDDLAKVATEDLVRDLVRCGVWYSSEYDCLAMSV